ncbi:hypothetical protein F4780DRAFT_758625 [Xylariomycetidae sp. FL0641]|nr:hypothetical protein F4780DRAFT_758625 [Xylariomycetidae sp. FL0641]
MGWESRRVASPDLQAFLGQSSSHRPRNLPANMQAPQLHIRGSASISLWCWVERQQRKHRGSTQAISRGFNRTDPPGISNKFRFGVLARKERKDDRFTRALKAPHSSFPASFDIDHVRQKHPKLVHAGQMWLVERLGVAMSQRRQFIAPVCEEQRQETAAATAHEQTIQDEREDDKAGDGETDRPNVSGILRSLSNDDLE